MSKKSQNRHGKAASASKPASPPESRREVEPVVGRNDSDPTAQTAKADGSAATSQQASRGTKPASTAAKLQEIRQPVRQATAQGAQADIRGVLIQLAGARLLLPNATIAEVLSYAPPEPVEGSPEWLLGKIRWRGWQLPLVAFAELAGVGREPAALGSKVVVLKALGGNAQAPYFAILSQGFPRLVTVARDGLVADSDNAPLPVGVQSRVMMNEDTAFVPDLGVVESLISQALAKAA